MFLKLFSEARFEITLFINLKKKFSGLINLGKFREVGNYLSRFLLMTIGSY